MTLNKIQSKTLQDLEFQTVVSQIKENAITDLGKQAIDDLVPFREVDAIKNTLKETSEYCSSFDNDNRIPSNEFESISDELKLLLIVNTVLEQESFKRIYSLCSCVNEHIKFFKKYKMYYPLLYKHTEEFSIEKEIPESIDKVFDKYGEIKNSASNELFDIRKKLGTIKDKINKSFNSALASYSASDYLDDIRESVIENKRVLAVKSMYRKKVKGSVLGSSKTGSIVFIEPDASMQHNRTLNNLIYEEEQEIRKILADLTDSLRPYRDVLKDFQNYLVHMDYTAAKAKYAKKINALMPVIIDQPVLDFKKAYHPLLLVSNNKTGAKTFPQDISLNESNRIVVISGPNAGGKSITLKTIGLLQLMLQSGILIPVHERSKACIFDRILTDIGDNQSIENHLSTYSYRLKNMNQFLKKCNHNTLFLIDEFGSGSDPELGGALAETFLEVFYEKGAYGVITTHYSNLKMLANELEAASNANMLFDPNSLEPTFQLMLGEAGSSFTFEVAQKNGIPYRFVNQAKKKIERGKVRFDATIAKLQKERSEIRKTGSKLKDEEQKVRLESDKLEKINKKLQDKLVNYQQLYDYNTKMIQLGTKLDELSEQYFVDNNKRKLVSKLLEVVQLENSKRKKVQAKLRKIQIEEKKKVAQELEKKIEVVRKEKKKKADLEQKIAQKPKPRPTFKVGDRVRLIDGKAVGSIDSIEKKKAVVNYGMFTTHVALDNLELVQAAK